MLLAIDAGNTNVSFALFEERKILASWRSGSHVNRTADEWAVWLLQLLDLRNIKPSMISGIMVSSVVPEILSSLELLCVNFFGKPFWIAGKSDASFGIKSRIDRPGEEGTDLMVNAIAAHTLFGGPLIVVDFGTATTFSRDDGNGDFCGVSIAPGVNLSMQALYQAAASLPRVSFSKPDKIIGTNTVESMQSGIFWGYLSMIEGMVSRIRAEYPDIQKVIATGGLGGFFAGETTIFDFYDRDLTLKGLQILYEHVQVKLLNQKSISRTDEKKIAS